MALLSYLPNIKPLLNPKPPSHDSNASNEFNMVKYEHKQMEMRLLLDKVQEGNNVRGLEFIDMIQRLGLDHHFEDQIIEGLKRHYQYYEPLVHNNNDHHDLNTISLRFRLLRQQGFYIPAYVFDNFKVDNMKFGRALCEDIRGLMALHEASHLRIEDEDILDEAETFTSKSLRAKMSHLENCHALKVQNTLNHPHHKSVAHLTAKNYLKIHDFENSWEKHLADFAIMDFDLTHSLYHEEIVQVFEWWKGLGLSEEMKLARNQPLKWYIWSMAMVPNPKLSKQRIELTKQISLVYVVDDIFDVYGTLEQLTLFTQAINRWEFSATDKLPSYMRMCFKVIHDTTHDISNMVYQEFGWNPINYLKKAWGDLCNAFLMEAKWFGCGQSPSADEYLENGIITSGVPMVLTNLYFLLGYGESSGTKHIQGIISSSAAILRLLDDLGSAKDEEQEGKDGSYVEYYMKEERDRTLSEGRQQVMDKVSEQWKLLNKHCLITPTQTIPSTFKTACLNLARMVPMMYTYDHTHRLPLLELHLKSMFSNIK